MERYAPSTVTCNDEVFEPYLTEQQIQNRIAELGQELTKDFDGKEPIFTGVLNGAFIFLADLKLNISEFQDGNKKSLNPGPNYHRAFPEKL